MQNLNIDSHEFSYVVNRLRTFFLDEGYLEVHTQNRLSILAACEDPSTISLFEYANKKYPLPQTGQMQLEFELLKDPSVPGYFCVSTSYRNEPNPIPGRHDLIFPMFEFELKGDMSELEKLERKLLEYLGYGSKESFSEGNYTDVAKSMHTHDIEHKHEQELYSSGHNVFFLKNFPEYTSPFWNMKRNEEENTANKIDVIMSGMETIGSAERSCDISDMLKRFHSISNGMYANTLYNHFGNQRVDGEMSDFLKLNFITRSGGGIGLSRLIRSMKMSGLIPQRKDMVKH